MANVDDAMISRVHDDLLRLVFLTCHPVNSIESQVALTLRVIGGLRTHEIARAFLVSEATMGQRISRAKRYLARGRVAFEMPPDAELPERVDAVLGVVYLIFNEGYAATSGADWVRPALCTDALRLGRMLAVLLPTAAEVHGLVALMELQASRLRARRGADGEPVLLADQDRRLWDRLLIRRGLQSLLRAEELGGGPYTLQAEVAACHARARSTAETDWRRIVALYTVLSHVTPSPVIALNRAIAVGMADGPEPALVLLDGLASNSTLAGYPALAAARGRFLAGLGQVAAARREFDRAAELTSNDDERRLYRRQAAALDP